MNLYSDIDLLTSNLTQLSSKDKSEREKAAVNIKAHVEVAARELSFDNFAKFESELYQRIFGFVHGDQMAEKMGGIRAIRELIDCASSSSEEKVIKFSTALGSALKTNTDFALTEQIADALGYMARVSPVANVDYVEIELIRSLDWLRGDIPYRRLAACVVLQQLAENAPTVFFGRAREFFDYIWGPLWDPREDIRVTAAKALCACLSVLRQRNYHLQWYYDVYEQIKVGLAKGTTECVHGSLLVAREVLRHTGNFMIPRFKEVCAAIFSMKDHKTILVRVAIIKLIPELAIFCPDAFQRSYLDESIDILIKNVRSPQSELRTSSLLAIGQLCKSMGSALYHRIDELDLIIREILGGSAVLQSGEKAVEPRIQSSKAEIPPEALLCVADMIRGLGTPFHSHVVGLLDAMLQSGLTQELIALCQVISTNLPGQKGQVQQRLLEEVMRVLGGASADSVFALIPPRHSLGWQPRTPSVAPGKKSGTKAGAAVASQTPSRQSIREPTTPEQSQSSGSKSIFKSLFSRGKSSNTIERNNAKEGSATLGTPSTPYYGLSGGALVYSFPGMGGPLGPGGAAGGRASGHEYHTPAASSLASLCGNRPPELVVLSLQTLSTLASTQTGVGTHLHDVNDLPPYYDSDLKGRNGRHRGSDYASGEHNMTSRMAMKQWVDYKDDVSSLGNMLIQLVPRIVVRLFYCDNVDVRREAIVTACKLISPYASLHRTRGPTASVVESTLRAIIEVAVVDPDPIVRTTALRSLPGSQFDRFLSQTHHLENLFLLLADEKYDIRLGALKVLGKLTSLNPSYLLANMRRMLLQLIVELRSGYDDRQKEEAALLLSDFMQIAPLQRLIKSFLPRLVVSLPLRCNEDIDIRLRTAGLEALGDLALVCRGLMLRFVDQLLPLVIVHVQDSSSKSKQEKAILALGKIASATGCVVKPYLTFPLLLPYLFQLLERGENSPWSLRREVLRTMGIIGSLEPRKYGLILNHRLRCLGGEVDEADVDADVEEMHNVGHNRFKAPNALDPKKDASGTLGSPDAKRVTGASTPKSDGKFGFQIDGISLTKTTSFNEKDEKVGAIERSAEEVLSEAAQKALSDDYAGTVINPRVNPMAFDDLSEPVHQYLYETISIRVQSSSENPDVQRLTPSNEDYYPKVAIGALMAVLRKPSLSVHHAAVIQAVMAIFKGLGAKCVQFLDQVIPYLLQIIHECGAGLRESLLQQFAQLAVIVKYNLGTYLTKMLGLVVDFWDEHTEHALVLAEEIAISAPNAITAFIPTFLPLLMGKLTLSEPNSTVEDMLYEYGFVMNVTDGTLCTIDGSQFFPWQLQQIPAFRQLERALSCVDTLKDLLAPYVALVCPTLCRLESQLRRLGPVGCVWQMCTLRTMHRLLCGNVTFTDAPPIAVRLLQTLTTSITELASRRAEKGFDKLWERERNGTLTTSELSSDHEHDPYLRVMNEALATICSVGKRLGHQFLTFDRQIRACITGPGIVGLNIRLYDALTMYIKGRNIDTEYRMLQRALRSGDDYYQFNGVSAGIGHNSQFDAALNGSRINMSSINLSATHGVDDIPPPFIDQQLSYYASVRTRKGSTTLFSGTEGLDPDDTYTSGEGKATMNHLVLQRAWDVSQRSTAADWNEWIRRLKIELLRESPSLSLRSCSSLSQAYSALADELFHPAFVSCWLELGDTHRDNLIKALTKAVSAASVSQEVIQKVLNLAEFMEHDVEPLPINPGILAELAQRSRAYAKALHYRELEFQVSPAECFENLINVNKKLDMYDAAFGVLKVVKQMQVNRPDLGIEIKPGWLAKLGFWEEALARCDEILKSDPNNCDAILGKIKSLDALGRWEDTVQLCLDSVGILKSCSTRQQQTASQQQQEPETPPGSTTIQSMKSRDIDNLSENAKGSSGTIQSTAAKDQSPIYARAAVVGARAAWALGEWDVMDSLVSELPESGLDTSFLKAVLAVHQEDFPGSSLYIDRTRRHLDDGIAALMEESYSRAYVHLVMVQQLSELEEVVEYKQVIRDAGFLEKKGGVGTPISSVPTLGQRFPSNPALMAVGTALTPNPPSFMPPPGNPALVGSPKVTPLTPYGVPKTIMSPLSRSKSGMFTNMTGDGGVMTTASVEEGMDDQGNQLSRHQTESLIELQERKQFMREKWRKKMTAGKSTGRSAIPYWQRLMNIHHMVLCEKEDLNTSLDFAMLSRRARNFHLSDRILNAVQGNGNKGATRPITTSSSVGNLGTMSLNDLSASAQSGLARIGSEPVLGVSRSLISREINPSQNFPASANFTLGGRTATAESPSRFNRQSSFGPAFDQTQDPETIAADRKIRFAVLRQAWAKGNHEYAIAELSVLLDQIRSENRTQFSTLPPNESNTSSRSAPGYISVKTNESGANFAGEISKLHLECLMKLGSWKLAVLGPAAVIDINTRQRVLELYREATTVDYKSYSAWHNWGLSNFRAIQESEKTTRGKGRRMSAGGGFRRLSSAVLIPDTQIVFIVSAVKGLMHAISLGTRKWTASVLQDMLYVLTIWFQYGHVPIVAASIEAGLSTMHLDTWLGVVPQLIARIDHNEDIPRHLLHNLLGRLGAKHPQALVYPLFVALKAPSEMRREAAKTQLNLLRQHSGTLIDQALLVTEELNRIAILWPEHWHETLEEASKQYFGEGNIVGMLETLAPVHELLERGPTTLHEASFCQSFGNELLEAGECLKRYVRIMNELGKEIPRSGAAPGNNPRKHRSAMSPEDLCLVQAWDLYYAVFKRITADLPQEMKLDLPQVSPLLVNCVDMNLAVPGSYSVNGSAVRIQKFGHVVHIIRSKQRPRKIRIVGEDGNEYVFLLKGHEDLRQDERVMQLFGLANALLAIDRSTDMQFLKIERYPVVPLSPNTGLVGWVPNCDTLHDLIRDFREKRKVILNVEQRIMQQVAPNNSYDQLTAVQKLEVFEYALTCTTGDDLAKILWYQSVSSEAWLVRRTRYTRSLAVMSVVGYILGLGDRHPSNLMLSRKTGNVLHIDFGDCFEVAMLREKFPEKVPFRLTRMLVKAMEVSGIEGTFRLSCEAVMDVLRANGDSLMAMLEAFVHDPLISWRLLGHDREAKPKKQRREGEAGRRQASEPNNTPKVADRNSVERPVVAVVAAAPVAPAPTITTTTTATATATSAATTTFVPPSPPRPPAPSVVAPVPSAASKMFPKIDVEATLAPPSTISATNGTRADHEERAGDRSNSVVSEASAGGTADPTTRHVTALASNVVHPGSLVHSSAPTQQGVANSNSSATTTIYSAQPEQPVVQSQSSRAPGKLVLPGFEGVDVHDMGMDRLSLAPSNNADALKAEGIADSSGVDTDVNLDDGDDTSIIIGDGSDGDVDTDGGEDDDIAQSLDTNKTIPIGPHSSKSSLKSPAGGDISNMEASSVPIQTSSSEEEEEEEEEDELGTATNLPPAGAIAASMARKSSYRPNLHESMMKLSTSMVERVSGSVIVASQSRIVSGSQVGRSLHLTGSLRDALMGPPTQIQLGDSGNKKQTSLGLLVTATTAAGSGAGAPVTIAASLVRTSSGLAGNSSVLAPAAATAAASMVMDANNATATATMQSGTTNNSGTWDDESGDFDGDVNEQLINERGLRVLQRVLDKLTGLDFTPVGDGPAVALDVPEQIDRLIKQATSNENLCVCFFGWCPFW